MTKPNFVYVTYIRTSPEKLWQALTDGAFTRAILVRAARRVRLDGGRPRHPLVRRQGERQRRGAGMRSTPATVLQLSCRVRRSDAREPPSRVTFEIEKLDVQVKLTAHP